MKDKLGRQLEKTGQPNGFFNEEELDERGIIAFCTMFFSAAVMTRITFEEEERAREKAMMEAGLYISVKEV